MLPPNPPLWIANSTKRRPTSHPALAFAARCAVGRPAKKTSGSAPAATNGTHSTREESAQLASITGLKLNASRVAVGRRIRIGMRSDKVEARQAASRMIVVSCPSFTEVFHN